MLDPKLLEILACPACMGELKLEEDAGPRICCLSCGRKYPVKDGIPVLLVQDAEHQ